MAKFYCYFCKYHLASDSLRVRNQHNEGKKHKLALAQYYTKYLQTRPEEAQRILRVTVSVEESPPVPAQLKAQTEGVEGGGSA